LKLEYNNALVTGGAGFIGSHIVDRLMGDGFNVTVIDDMSTGCLENLAAHMKKDNFSLIRGDVRDFESVKKVMENVEVVFHEASLSSVQQSLKDALVVNEINVRGTLNLLRASVDSGVKRFIYASSASVYGDSRQLPLSEEEFPRPTSPYGASKLAAETYATVFNKAYGLETVCLRYFNVYGPRQAGGDYAGVTTSFMEKLAKNEPPTIYGDGEQTRDFVYVGDVVAANVAAMEEKNATGEIFNIATGTSVTVNELFKILRKVTGRNQIQPEYSAPRKSDIRKSLGDISKASNVLGYKPRVSIDDGLERLAESCSPRSR
jgi:UDP-N-acetylglucosamine 4-epimerase